jgi:hypothetical protein
MKERQRINLDSLFPGKTIEIGNSAILIKPLVLEQIAVFTKRFKEITDTLNNENIDWSNFDTPENILLIANKIIIQFPDLLEEATNIAKDDLLQLPIELVTKLIIAVVEVNLQAKDDLLGNFQSLIKTMNPKIKKQGKIKKKLKLQKQSKN